jgi:hypothetical protein
MRLSRNEAIELCIDLWSWLAKTGNRKCNWPEWEKYRHIVASCFFCEYQEQQCRKYKPEDELDEKEVCRYCPLKKLGKDCMELHYGEWEKSPTIKDRKKYAKLFLEQIKQCQ